MILQYFDVRFTLLILTSRWLSSSTSGSGWGSLRFESGSIPTTLKMVLIAPQLVLVIMSLSKGQLIPYTMDLQARMVYFKELIVLSDKRV